MEVALALVGVERSKSSLLIQKAPGFVPDADDTAKALLTLALVGRPASPRALIETFGNGTYFKTYTLERNASFSANCNVLKAFLHLANMDDYISHISKTATFLCNLWYHESPKDKWASPLTVGHESYANSNLESLPAILNDASG